MGDTISSQSGGVDVTANSVTTRDVTGRDKIVSAGGDVVEGDKIVQEAPRPIVLALHQLPPPPADFTGRTVDIDAILKDIAGGAVISGVRGMGGIGKTALALVIAQRLKAQYPDAQFFVPLRGASDKPLTTVEALTHVIRAYHPTAQLPDEVNQLTALYRSVLAGQCALIVLDDAKDADQVRPLLPPTCCLVLITTRNHFHVPGLRAKDLNVLSPDDARKLLGAISDRLKGVSLSREAAKKLCPEVIEIPGVARNDTFNAVDLIAEMCGYLPLALTVAGATLTERADLPVPDYIKRLYTNRLKQLSAVDAALQASYDLLSADLQALWRQLAVFPADFDRLAATYVWFEDYADEFEDKAQDALSDLVKYSLVQYDETTARYSLHDLARLFALALTPVPSPNGRGATEGQGVSDLLPSPVDALFIDGGRAGDGGDLSAARYRHAAHYQDVLAACDNLYLQGNDGILQGLSRFDREWPNIQAGHHWASTQFVGADPRVGQIPDRANTRVRLYADEAARLCADYPNAGVYTLDLRLHARDLIHWREQALAAARYRQDKSAEGAHLGNLGNAYADLGEPRRAIEFYEQCLTIAREIGDRRDEGNALMNTGNVHYSLGEYQQAIEYYEQALPIFREIGDRRGEGNSLMNAGNVHYSLGEYQQAIEYHEQALPIFREIGDRRGEGSALMNTGNVHYSLGEYQQAIECHEQALPVFREIGDRRGEGNALGNMALALDELGERAQAISLAEAALKIYEQIEDPNATKVRRKLADWKA